MGIAGILLSLGLVAGMSSGAGAELRKRADEAFAKQDWDGAARLFAELNAAAPTADGLLRQGQAELHLGRYAEAAQTLARSVAKDPAPMGSHLSLAIARFESGDRDGALSSLRDAAARGATPELLEHHPSLAPLRQDPRFAEVVADAERRSYPCERDPRYRAFDFWLGDWDVGPAHSRITREISGCMVHERWSSPYGRGGESINYFDPTDGRWHQDWVGSTGNVVHYVGGPTPEGAMHMEGSHALADGSREQARVTWTPLPDGTVHHLIEHSKDGGRSWYSYFDAIYRRAATPTAKEPTPGR